MLTASQQQTNFQATCARALKRSVAKGETMYVVWDVDDSGTMRHFVASAFDLDTYHAGAQVVWSTDEAE